jgi:hypothetical protein
MRSLHRANIFMLVSVSVHMLLAMIVFVRAHRRLHCRLLVPSVVHRAPS